MRVLISVCLLSGPAALGCGGARTTAPDASPVVTTCSERCADAGSIDGGGTPAWAQGDAAISVVAVSVLGLPHDLASAESVNSDGRAIGIGGRVDGGAAVAFVVGPANEYEELRPDHPGSVVPYGVDVSGNVLLRLTGAGLQIVLGRPDSGFVAIPLTEPAGLAEGPLACGRSVDGPSLWTPSGLTPMDGFTADAGFFAVQVNGCTSDGRAVGSVQVSRRGEPVIFAPFIWDGMVRLLASSGRFSSALDVSETGIVAGYRSVGLDARAAVWEGEFALEIQMPPDVVSATARGVSSRGVVIGDLINAAGEWEAWAWARGRLVRLNDALPPGVDLRLQTARDVSADGRFVVGAARSGDAGVAYRVELRVDD